jgi:SAM-dependent methyltransferase
MIEIQDYRSSERHARSIISSWWLAESHQVEVFAKIGFPVRIESVHEIGQLVDTMQENRYERFLSEIGGLSEEDARLLTVALRQCVLFQRACLPKRRPILPISTMTSALLLFRKIRGFKPTIESILEVGPGCGYLSFFLAQHAPLADYSQAEACESFYIMQSMINSYLFGHRHRDFVVQAEAEDMAMRVRSDIDRPVFVEDHALPAPVCFHYPWWMLRALCEKRFDLVTSNANLSEFTRPALRDYLTIFSHALKDDGVLLVQCTGNPAGRGTLDDLFDTLHDLRFAAIFCGLADESASGAALTALSAPYLARRFDGIRFALNNLVLVKEGHPLFLGAWDRRNFRHGFAAEFKPLVGMFGANVAGRRPSRAELASLVMADLKSGGSAQDQKAARSA